MNENFFFNTCICKQHAYNLMFQYCIKTIVSYMKHLAFKMHYFTIPVPLIESNLNDIDNILHPLLIVGVFYRVGVHFKSPLCQDLIHC